MVKSNEIQLTFKGVKEKEKRLKELVKIERPKVLIELSEARSQGDLSENADYDAAKEKQAKIEAEILEIEIILANVSIIRKNSSKKISLGNTVTYQRIDDKSINKIKLVGSLEVDPTADVALIGSDSPIGVSIMGTEKGDTVTVEAAEKYDIIIKKAE